MGALKYTITVESNAPPQLYLGAIIGGATVVEMRQEKIELISAAEIAQRHGISAATVRRKLAAINQGTEGKFLYDPTAASQMLKDSNTKRGRKRAN
ncbi:HTH domain-containing protein [Acinetobacter sp. YH12086]|uniref:HTH domain-containing protein n=1 Tax=Acinetobacter sp. YH12086 TaxID=2601078 RepID=UPI0015D13582|nr:HTH domain-containing protein [Acinetobacter sp. YH12086]